MNLKKIIVILLVCSLFIASVSSTMASSSDSIIKDEAFMEAQHKCVEMYNRLTTGMDIETQNCYGGAYIDENLNLVVLLNNMKITDVIKVEQLTGTKNLIIKSCEYTYDELVETINIVVDNIENLSDKGVNVDSIQDNLYNNQVEVCVRDLDENKISIIKSIIDEPFLVFFNSEKSEVPCANIRGGYSIYNNDSLGYGTLGFCAYNNYGVSGYVISGHVGDGVGDDIEYNGTIIGDVDVNGYSNYSDTDAAFVESNGNGTLTDDIVLGDIVMAIYSDLPVGTTVSFWGDSSSLETGTVTSNNYAYYDGTYNIAGCMRASFTGIGGDSGAPVFYSYGNGYNIVGILNTAGGGCTKYRNIVSKLGIICKTN